MPKKVKAVEAETWLTIGRRFEFGGDTDCVGICDCIERIAPPFMWDIMWRRLSTFYPDRAISGYGWSGGECDANRATACYFLAAMAEDDN